MRRERKHRAWHIESEKMIYDSSANIFKWISEGQPIEVMDHSGLKDKNGKEIYEGDFISTDLQRPFFQVVFKNGAFMCRCFDDYEYDDIFFPTSDEQQTIYKYGEVIGNLFENPELLNKAEE